MKSKSKSNVISNLEYIILEFLLFMGMLSGYVGHTRIWRYTLLMLIAIALTINNDYFSRTFKNSIINLLLCVLVILLVLNYLVSPIKSYASQNLTSLIYPIICIIPLQIISENKTNVLGKFLADNVVIINGWLWLNLLIIIIQVNGNPIFLRNEWIAENPFYPDLCCGLFGCARTNALALYCCFAIIYDYIYIERLTGNAKKRMKFLTVLATILVLWISSRNDNMFVFILLPACYLVYYFSKGEIKIDFVMILKKSLKFVLLAIFLIIILFQIPIIREFLVDSLGERVNKVLVSNSQDVAYGSNERLAILSYALSNEETWYLGQGIGVSPWRKSDTFGFRHYGLSSIGTVTNLLGVWCTSIIIIIYAYICYRMFHNYTGFEKKVCAVIALAFTIAISIYTELFTTDVFAYWFVMMFSVYALKDHKAEEGVY